MEIDLRLQSQPEVFWQSTATNNNKQHFLVKSISNCGFGKLCMYEFRLMRNQSSSHIYLSRKRYFTYSNFRVLLSLVRGLSGCRELTLISFWGLEVTINHLPGVSDGFLLLSFIWFRILFSFALRTWDFKNDRLRLAPIFFYLIWKKIIVCLFGFILK